MAQGHISVPDDLADFLTVEDCSDFPVDRYLLTPNQRKIAEDIVRIRRITKEMRELNLDYLNATLLYGVPGTGKAQPLYSKVLTPDGFIRMGDIKEGSLVVTPSGKAAKVSGIYPQGIQDIYEIEFDDGGKCRCSDEHLWEVQGPDEREASEASGRRISRVMSLKDILEGFTENKYCIEGLKVKGNKVSEGASDRYIKRITPKGRDECQCIYIDDPRHLYITDDHIVTHNTTFGRYLACKFKIDFAFLNFANLVGGGVMGDTSRNISRVFRFMQDQTCIFMLDEIDCISVTRGQEGAATGRELSRITITVMQELDRYKRQKVNSIIIAATNRIEDVDPALRSRFAIKKEIVGWNNEQKYIYAKKFLSNLKIPYDDENVHQYCSRNSTLQQREIEADMIRCIANWIDNDRRDFFLEHIREK